MSSQENLALWSEGMNQGKPCCGKEHITANILRRQRAASEEEVSEKPGKTTRGHIKQAVSKEQTFNRSVMCSN